MKNKKSLLYIIGILLLIILILCVKKPLNLENDVGENAKKVIQAMFTGPDQNLYNKDYMNVVGEGIDISQEKDEKAEALRFIKENWQDEVGECFSEGTLDQFIESGPALQYLIESETRKTKISIEEINLKQKEASTEVVSVTFLVGEEKRKADVFFRYDSEGLIEEVRILKEDTVQ